MVFESIKIFPISAILKLCAVQFYGKYKSLWNLIKFNIRVSDSKAFISNCFGALIHQIEIRMNFNLKHPI